MERDEKDVVECENEQKLLVRAERVRRVPNDGEDEQTVRDHTAH